jgi:hypothetical protein
MGVEIFRNSPARQARERNLSSSKAAKGKKEAKRKQKGARIDRRRGAGGPAPLLLSILGRWRGVLSPMKACSKKRRHATRGPAASVDAVKQPISALELSCISSRLETFGNPDWIK